MRSGLSDWALGSTSLEPRRKHLSASVSSVKVLLVSQDIQTIETLCHLMGQTAMYVEVCSDARSATRKLCHSKFEGVAVDFKGKTQAMELLTRLPKMTSHRAAVVLAILDRNDDLQSAFSAGANFILERPFSPRISVPTLKASFSLMMRERRRYFRCPLQTLVSLSTSSRSAIDATSVNLSEGGMALLTAVPLEVGESMQLSMTLPGTARAIKLQADVSWNDNAGRIGMQFTPPALAVSERLQSWLSEQLEHSPSERESW
jgi:DNA-binding response OmpR family regulator